MKLGLHANEMDTLTYLYVKIKSGLNSAIARCIVVSIFSKAAQYLDFMIVS